MRILIFTAATGGGHRRTSQAMAFYFSEHLPQAQVKQVDCLREINILVDKTVCGSYEFMATKAPKMYGKLYNNTQKSKVDVVPVLTALCSRRLLSSIQEFQPDVIITTHPFAGQMVSHLKGLGKVVQPLISIMTDYGPHRAYLADGIDAYIVPCVECKEALVHMGVAPERIYPYGIPVFDAFFERRDPVQLRRELGLDPDLPALLIMAGSFGVSNIMGIYQELEQLSEKFQFVVITGRNRKLYELFEKQAAQAKKPCKLVFFTDAVQSYMQACDLIITKPGGLTISESLASNLPLVVFDSIPGQEKDNARFLVQHGMAVRIRKGDPCGAIVEGLLQNPERLAAMRAACEQFDASQACAKLAALMQSLVRDGVPAHPGKKWGRKHTERPRRKIHRRAQETVG